MLDRATLGLPDHLEEFNSLPERPVRAPNRSERRRMDRSARRASRHWIARQRKAGRTDEEIGLLLDYAETLPALVSLPEETPA